ncbi:receptor-like protein kinase THESEUS 1 [Bidens hawaiensis]|uniref:receptor-like protein kinase THESEUS 1 n=1 Tax=Bidens hawaiensis TaxID=980011 RepID=UPI0040499A18
MVVFGRVYKGELSRSKGQIMVAIKRLDRMGDQGEAEFLKELMTLSRYRLENLISLICLGAAKGLRHLHDPKELHQRLIHCDVKSGNILLDDHWNAKVADFGFSIMGPANQQQSAIINLAAGTLGYCDPQFDNNGRAWILVPSWAESYEENKLSDIIFTSSNIQPIDQICLETFSGIAYRCLNKFRKDRPKMAEVVSELALEIQEFKEGKLPSFSY